MASISDIRIKLNNPFMFKEGIHLPHVVKGINSNSRKQLIELNSLLN